MLPKNREMIDKTLVFLSLSTFLLHKVSTLDVKMHIYIHSLIL